MSDVSKEQKAMEFIQKEFIKAVEGGDHAKAKEMLECLLRNHPKIR